jgi:hypothetical protein
MTTLTLKREAAGVYVTEDGEHAIIRTEDWEGPRGGKKLYRWEIATRILGDWCVDGLDWDLTLKAARGRLEMLLANPS